MTRFAGLSIVATLFILLLMLQQDAPRATAEGPPPPAPQFQATIDESSPADPSVAPVDDDCPVGVPCKIRTSIVIFPGAPVIPIAGVTPGAFFVAPGAYVPDGLRVGVAAFATTIAVSTIGPCETNSFPYGSGALLVDATIDPHTSTGAPSDLASFQHWPHELNDELVAIAGHIPNPALWARYVGVFEITLGSMEYYVPVNVLVIRAPDGSFVSAYLVGDPSARNPDGSMQLGGPDIHLCSPFAAQSTIQGVAVDPSDGDLYPLRACLAPGPHPFAAILIPLDPGTQGPIILGDPVFCSGQLADSDSDGVPDVIDVCDSLPEDHDGVQDRDGCPEVDADHDAVPDTADNCPQAPNPGQIDSDDDGHGDACDPDDDNDTYPDLLETRLGSDPLSAGSTPEHVVADGTCADGLDNDGDGASDEADTGCHPYADFDGDEFPNVVEEQLGSNPNDSASTPEHFVLTPTCFDSVDNDLDTLVDSQDPACFPFLDSDGDGFIDTLEEKLGSDPGNAGSTPEHFLLTGTCIDSADNDLDGAADNADDGCLPALDPDGDGFASALEYHLGSGPLDAQSTPENIAFPQTCTDGLDNDGDERADFRDSGCLILDVDGDGSLNQNDTDDDNDDFADADEDYMGTNPNQSCSANSWPPDFDDSQSVTIIDVLRFKPLFNTTATSASRRFDLAGHGPINVIDILALKPHFGKTC